jgi:hypothetical protein
MSLDQEQAIKAAIRQFAITGPEHQKRQKGLRNGGDVPAGFARSPGTNVWVSFGARKKEVIFG